MTTYKGIKGLSIHTVDGDPSVLAAGDIWYDSAAKIINKVLIVWARVYTMRAFVRRYSFDFFAVTKAHFIQIPVNG